MQKGEHGRDITAAAVCIERNDRHRVVYRGTRQALIAAGLVRAENFPERNGRISWHYPKAGQNWSLRRKNGDVYCLTKLKDRRGIVDAEAEAFKRVAAARARRDAGFQRFMHRMRGGAERTASKLSVSPVTQNPASNSAQDRDIALGPHRIAERAPGHIGGFERLAAAALVVGITIFFWTRRA
jgi:hypothetical protein